MPRGFPDFDPIYPEFIGLSSLHPVAYWGGACVALALLLLGCARLLVSGGSRRQIAGWIVLAPVVSFAVAKAGGSQLYPWYLLFALPGTVALAAIGADGLFARLPGSRRGALTAAAMAGLLAGYALLDQPMHHALRTRSLNPIREALEVTGRRLDPHAPQNEAQQVIAVYKGFYYYGGLLEVVRHSEDLREAMARSRETKMPLVVAYSSERRARRLRPGLMEFLDRENLFAPMATLHGVQRRYTYRVFRYAPQPGAHEN